MIKAPSHQVLRAYLYDITPFCQGMIRRVLIDEYGMVFVPGWGWSNIQENYKIKVFAEPIDMFRDNVKHDDWWERRGWQDKAWSWCYFWTTPEFFACRIDNGYVFAA